MIREQGFQSIGALTHFCKGGILGGPVKHERGYAVSGLTLTFSNPSAAITFTGSNPLSFAQLADQVRSQSSSEIDAVIIDGFLGFVEHTPTTGISIAAGAQPVLALLGLNAAGGLQGNVLNAPGAPYGPYYVSIFHNGSTHTLVYDDSFSQYTPAPISSGTEVDDPASLPADLDIDPPTRAIYVGLAGDLKVLLSKDTVPVTYKNVAVGMIPLSIKRLYNTTTAALLILEKLHEPV